MKRGGVAARATIAGSESMPIMFAAEVLGLGSDPERAIRLAHRAAGFMSRSDGFWH
jgi:hypothetical protein